MSLNPLQALQGPSSAPGSASTGGVSVSVPIDVSTAIKSAAESALNSSGSQYNLGSGSFVVGGGGNNMIFILGAVAVGIFFIMRKFK